MSGSESASLVDLSVEKLYLATCEGRFCAPAEDVSGLDVLLGEGYVEVTECRSDPRSGHGAKTCRVRLVWLTDRGKEFGRKATEGFDEKLKELNHLLEGMNPRVSVLAEYLLARWAVVVLAQSEVTARGMAQRRGWDMLTSFEWDISVPGAPSMLPEWVRGEFETLSKRVVELGLGGWNRLGHDTQGWYESEVLVTTRPIATAILGRYGGSEVPFFVRSLISSVSRADVEAKLAFCLGFHHRIRIESMVEYLNYGSYYDLVEFLRIFEGLMFHSYGGYAHVNWDLVERYVKPQIRYFAADRDDMLREAVSRSLHGLLPSIHEVASLRHHLVSESVRKALAGWFDTGDQHLDEVPPFRRFWDLATREKREEAAALLDKLPKISTGAPETSS
jgi:hypothetical protein